MQGSKVNRPVGVAILAWLGMIGGVLGFIGVLVLLVVIPRVPAASGVLRMSGMPLLLVAVVVSFILVLAFVSGAGMWMGRKWGWFAGSFLYMYSVVRNLHGLLVLPGIFESVGSEGLAEMSHEPGYYYVKYGLRAIVQGLIYLYFFKQNVRDYFQISEARKLKVVLVQLVVCVGLIASVWFAAQVMSSSDSLDEEILDMSEMYDRGQYEQLIATTGRYLDTHPESAVAWSRMGWGHLKLEHPGEAEICFKKALSLDSNWDNAYVGLGALYRKQGEMDKARESYEEAIRLVPDNAEAFASLLVIELMEGNDARAVEYGERAWELRKTNPTIPANLSVAYHYVEDFERRDIFYGHAKRLGYHYLQGLEDIFEGKSSLR